MLRQAIGRQYFRTWGSKWDMLPRAARGMYQACGAVLKAPAAAIVNILALDTWVEMGDKSRLSRKAGRRLASDMLAEPPGWPPKRPTRRRLFAPESSQPDQDAC